jgi:PEP-CTERM motif
VLNFNRSRKVILVKKLSLLIGLFVLGVLAYPTHASAQSAARAGGQAGVVDNSGRKDKDKDKDKDKGPNRPNSVPEPASIGLIALGGASVVWYRRRQRTRKQSR